MTYSEFWNATPFQTKTKTAAVQKERRQWSIHQAWHTEAFARHKRLPSLRRVLGDTGRTATSKQTPERMFANLAKIAGVKRDKKSA